MHNKGIVQAFKDQNQSERHQTNFKLRQKPAFLNTAVSRIDITYSNLISLDVLMVELI